MLHCQGCAGNWLVKDFWCSFSSTNVSENSSEKNAYDALVVSLHHSFNREQWLPWYKTQGVASTHWYLGNLLCSIVCHQLSFPKKLSQWYTMITSTNLLRCSHHWPISQKSEELHYISRKSWEESECWKGQVDNNSSTKERPPCLAACQTLSDL